MSDILNENIIILVSSCLAGEATRYDGIDSKNSNNSNIINFYSKHFTLKTICPEIEIGLGVPRDPIQIIQDTSVSGKIYLVDKKRNTLDYTCSMLNFAKQYFTNQQKYCAYIVKEKSPSCGFENTPYFSVDGNVINYGSGVFTNQLKVLIPWLPIISEEGLEDIKLQDNFLERIYVLNLWNTVYKEDKNSIGFNTMIKHQLNIRGVKLIPKLEDKSDSQKVSIYLTEIMSILKQPLTSDMQIKFLTSQLDEFNLSSKNSRNMLIQYKNKKVSLLVVLKEFQKMFKNKSSENYSNYFYPSEHEICSRGYYFGE